MFEELDDMSLLSDEQVDSLFGNGEVEDTDKGGGQEPLETKEQPDKDPSKTKPAEDNADVDPETLFGDDDDDDSPESVGREKQGKQDDAPSDGDIPPFSSFAKALKEDGIFLNLDDSDLENVKNGADFEALIDKEVQSRLDDRQKRIDEALNNGVEPDVISRYENILHNLNSITTEQLEAEGDQGDNLRYQILRQDYLNKGFNKERAERAAKQAIDNGTDIDDAKEALESIKRDMQAQYQSKLDEAKASEEEIKARQEEQAKQLRKSLLEDKELFGDLEVDKAMRQRALDAIVKPVYQDPESGVKYTAIQLYEKDNRVDFLKKIGLIYAMTDGFKTLDGLVGKKVKKEVGKGMKAIESALNGTRRKADGSIDYAGGSSMKDSLGFTLDV